MLFEGLGFGNGRRCLGLLVGFGMFQGRGQEAKERKTSAAKQSGSSEFKATEDARTGSLKSEAKELQ